MRQSPPATESLSADHLLSSWRGFAPATRRLLGARFWRSLAQGALVVDIALYLHALGWSGAAIGAVLSGGGLVGAGLNLAVGVVSDRSSRKPFLLAYEALTCICALVALFTTRSGILAAAIVFAGFGRGANGAAGPFAPAEQAWLAEAVEPAARGFVYSVNVALGFTGMTIGAFLAMLPALWQHWLGPADAFRPLFLLVLLGNVVNFFLLWRTPELRRVPARTDSDAAPTAAETGERRRENRFLGFLMGLNVLNGFAVGLTGPLMAYWFQRRFHVGPSVIAPAMALTFAITAAGSLVAGQLSRSTGVVRVVVWGRGAGAVLLLLLPLMPAFWLAALLYLLRSVFNRGTIGARQALVIGAVREERRGLASSLNALSMQLPQSVGPAIAGSMIGAGWFAAPFVVGAALQGLYALFYGRLFASQEPGSPAAIERANP